VARGESEMILDPIPKLLDLPAHEYHSYFSRVSHSMLEVFRESRRLYEGRFITKKFPHDSSPKMDFGKAAHALTLESSVIYVRIPRAVLNADGHKKGAAWKEFEAAHAGQILLKPSEVDDLQHMVDAMQSHPLARDMLEAPGRREVVVHWTDEETGVDRKARLDMLEESFLYVADMKGTGIIKPDDWAWHCWKMGYHRQAASYSGAIEQICKKSPAFYFVVVLTEAPYTVEVFELSEMFLQIGRDENTAALKALIECERTGDWSEPGFGHVKTISPPARIEREYFSRI
jgi:hypothetical protein